MNQSHRTVKMETLPIEGVPTQNVPAVSKPGQGGTGKLESLANPRATDMPLHDVLNQRIAHVVQAKAERGDAIARYNACLQYTPEIKWFDYDDMCFRLLQILGMHDGVMLVEAQRTTGKIWHLEIPQMTEFKNILFRGD